MIKAPIMPTTRVLCIGGSSITHTPRLRSHWPQDLARRLSAEIGGHEEPQRIQPIDVMQYGRGEPKRVLQLLQDPHLYSLMTDHTWHAVVLELGSADARAGGTPKRIFEDAVRSMLERLAWHEVHAVLCTPPVVIDGDTPKGWNRKTRRWVEYAPTILTRVASQSKQHPSARVEIARWDDMPAELYQQDGVHPNADGCAWMAGRVFDALQVLRK